MKRAGNLYSRIAAPDNLRLAFWKAQRGKQGKLEVRQFRAGLDREMEQLRRDLVAGNVALGDYHYFTIQDPKERRICAASFRERVLHHAIMNVCEPAFESYQISDSYACRKGKGTHAAVSRAQSFARRCGWYLKLDVRGYFDSIDHNILMRLLRRRFKDGQVLELFCDITGSYATLPGKGIPIGNLTSQYFANHYLGVLDHFVKEQLRVPGYVRYMDDMVLWSDDRAALRRLAREVQGFVADELALDLKPPCLNRTTRGLTFLGYRIFPDRILLAARSRRRLARKLRAFDQLLAGGAWSQEEYAAHVTPLLAFSAHASSAGLRRKIISKGAVHWAPTA